MSTTESHNETDAVIDPNAISMTINGKVVAARKGEWIIAAADRTEDFIPRFCYHPRMESVGMCRQCLVEVEGPHGPMMVVSCMTPVAEGQVVRTDTDIVKRIQEGMIELLLANHPLDCPVCDKGGECPLQDQAFSHGPGESRYVEEKRHYEKPIPISGLVLLDRERCILCDQCTRFADEVAGDPLITFTHRGNNTQVMTFPDEPFASYFSGNTVQICPVGALTAEPYRFKARPWDLQQQESTCTTCSVGCRTVVQSSYDEILRYQGVDSDPVNWGWLCDRGRFNFQSTNSPNRLATPLVKTDAGLVPESWTVALDETVRVLRHARPGSIAILGGARGTNEDAWAWAQLADLLGIEMRDAQLDDGLPAEIFGYPNATIDDACSAATVILLAPDLKEELPVLYLRLRGAAEKKKIRIIEIATHDSGLTRYAWKSVMHEPGQQAEAVQHVLSTPEMQEQLSRGAVVVVAGRSNLAEAAHNTMAAVDAIVTTVAQVSVLPVLRRGNVRGALSLGLAPRMSTDAAAILEASANGKVDCLILLGADPLSDVPDADLARRGIAGARYIIAIDTFLNKSSVHADIVLPAAAYGEKDGTTTNLEGRVTNVVQSITPHATSRPDWMIAIELAALLGNDLGILTLQDIQTRITETVVGFDGLSVSVAVRKNGVLISTPPISPLQVHQDEIIKRNAYEFRLVVARKLYDQAVATAMSQSLAALAPGAGVFVHPLDLERVGAKDGSSVRVSNNAVSVILPAHASTAVMRGTAFVPFNQQGVDIRELLQTTNGVTDVQIANI
ncbi:MAG: NADH dehydrogenase (quinone) subunit G [Ilumatobacteraceae bacterium]|nr:NADH dehydrogenase (quinone) subunit G [Ilumatobacteraceae bacterium]